MVLNNYLHPSMSKHIKNEREVLFHQDKARIHSAFWTREWLHLNFVRALGWPVCPPDFNLIENIWEAMVRNVYEREKQYFAVS